MLETPLETRGAEDPEEGRSRLKRFLCGRHRALKLLLYERIQQIEHRRRQSRADGFSACQLASDALIESLSEGWASNWEAVRRRTIVLIHNVHIERESIASVS